MVIITTPTNYDDIKHFFCTTAVDDAIESDLKVNPDILTVIKSAISVEYSKSSQEKYEIKKHHLFQNSLVSDPPLEDTTTIIHPHMEDTACLKIQATFSKL